MSFGGSKPVHTFISSIYKELIYNIYFMNSSQNRNKYVPVYGVNTECIY